MPAGGNAKEMISFKAGLLDGPGQGPEDVPGALFLPDGAGPFPAVVLLPHCGGFDSKNVQSGWPSVLLKSGYAVLTVDTFAPQGTSTCVGLNKGDSRPAQARFAVGALNYLAQRPDIAPDRIGVMGFSEGAFTINNFLAPESKDRTWVHGFGAAVSMYGGCANVRRHRPVDVPLLLVEPEHDTMLNGGCIAAATGGDHIYLQILEGAYHGFDNPDINRPKKDDAGNEMLYSSSATDAAEKYAVVFLDAKIGKNRGKPLERNVILGGDQAYAALEGWVEENAATACAGDLDAFTRKIQDLAEKWVDDKKVVAKFTVSKFKAKFMHAKLCKA